MKDRIAKAYRAWVIYRDTHARLMSLSDRDLADLGIKRGRVETIALESARLAA